MNLNYKTCDVALIKLGVFFMTLFLISVWSGFANLVIGINWIWFLIVGIAFMVKPIITTFKK